MPDTSTLVTVTLTDCEARALRRMGSLSYEAFAGILTSDKPLAIETALLKLETAMVIEGVAE